MAEWSRWSVVFFAYLALAAEIRPGMALGARVRVWCGAALGSAIAVAGWRLPAHGLANALFLPSTVLLIAYWTSGRLYVRPMPRLERALASVDAALRVPAITARCPRLAAELLEFSYSSIYWTMVAALVVALRHGVSADRFWTTVLVTDFICFGTMPWFQTRPPRALAAEPPWHARLRAVSERMLQAGGVHVNTFPSGHAAEAMLAALLASAAPGWVVAVLLANAIAVTAGAVLGRYHYAADALAGWGVALIVWWMT